MEMLIGVWQVEPGVKNELIYEWRYQVQTGEKYEPDVGWTKYTDRRAKEGDMIQMVVTKYDISFWINEVNLGPAFIDERLNTEYLYPIIWLGHKGDIVELLPGGKC